MSAATIDRPPGGPPSIAAARWLAFAGLALAADLSASNGVANIEMEDPPSTLIARALAYEHGEGVTKDPFKAAALYCAAARAGDSEAQFSLGWMYANGRGVAHDDAVAASLFALAAAAGHAEARRMQRFIGDDRGTLPVGRAAIVRMGYLDATVETAGWVPAFALL